MTDRLPHGPAALFLRSVIEARSDELTCEACVPIGSAHERGGRCPSFVTVELAAQAGGLLHGRRASDKGRPRAGFVVRVHEARFERLDFGAGEPLRVHVRRTAEAGPLTIYDALVLEGEAELARVELALYTD